MVQVCASPRGGEAQRRHEAGDTAAEALENPALAPHHVAMVRHHLCRPGGRIVQPRQIIG